MSGGLNRHLDSELARFMQPVQDRNVAVLFHLAVLSEGGVVLLLFYHYAGSRGIVSELDLCKRESWHGRIETQTRLCYTSHF